MFQKIKYALIRFMQGRHGADQLSRFMLWTAVALYFLALFPGMWLLGYIGLFLLFWNVFRMLSKNTARRTAENAKYLQLMGRVRTWYSQARMRFKNRKEYKYFRCPHCKSWLKLKRGAGEGTLTCGNCKHAFKAKA